MEKKYRIAGVEIEILIPEELDMKREGYLQAFQVDNVSNPHRFYFDVVEEVEEPRGHLVASFPGNLIFQNEKGQIRYGCVVESGWWKADYRVESKDKEHFVQVRRSECGGKIGPKIILNVLGAERLFLEKNGIILHASFIKYKGHGILFTAPSGTGKSTQADLWADLRGGEIINGDRAVIRSIDDKVSVCGIPFAGSSSYCVNGEAPLAAIVYLNQASETVISCMGKAEAFRKVWEGCTVSSWDSEAVEKAIQVVQEVIMSVPVYHLSCTPDESAVIALEKELEKEC